MQTEVQRHRVREHIQDAIVRGRWQPQQKLVQEKLAAELGVSRSVIREATLELCAQGLLEAHDNRGVAIASFSRDDIAEAYEIREMLEGLAVRRCCDTMTVPQLRQLQELTARIEQARAQDDAATASRHDREFHQALVRIAGSRMLQKVVQSYWMLSKFLSLGGKKSPVDHVDILNAIITGDKDAAERLARQHVQIGKGNIMQLLETTQADLASNQPVDLSRLST